MSIKITKNETGSFALKVNSAYFYGVVDGRIAFALLTSDKSYCFESIKSIREYWQANMTQIIYASKYNVYIPIHNTAHPYDITIVKAHSPEALHEILEDVFVTALEGGSNYWMEITDKSYERIKKPFKGKQNMAFSEKVLSAILFHGVRIKIIDAEDPETVLCNLDADLLSERYAKLEEIVTNRNIILPEGKGKGCEEALRRAMCNLYQEGYDAGDADVIMQYLCLEDIVYG